MTAIGEIAVNKIAIIAALGALLLISVGAAISQAHPGRTASDGCHYCRTRCDYWGVPWNARHCHLNPEFPEPTRSADDPATAGGIKLKIGTVEIQQPPESDIEPMRSGRGEQ